jgi:diguanylate cyclase (GGDEF)-like protein
MGASTIARDITARLRDRAQLRFLAEHDPLTGAGNRRGFEQAISRHVDHARRHDDHAALLLIDIDDFKEINDTYGHTAGDRALQLVADTLTGRLRDGDQIARIGGDEFAILLPEASKPVASALASDLKRLVQGTPLDLVNGTRIPFSISVGIAIIDKTTASQETVVDIADRAMYEDKHTRPGKQDSDPIAPNHPRLLRQRSRRRPTRRPHRTTTGRAAASGSSRFQRDARRR